MLLKNHLIEIFKKASSENNILLKENIVLKWVHRFGIDSLKDLLIHSSALREYHNEEEKQDNQLETIFEKEDPSDPCNLSNIKIQNNAANTKIVDYGEDDDYELDIINYTPGESSK